MWVATLSLPAALRPPVAEWTPVEEGGSSAGRASSPKDSLTVYVARVHPLVLALVGPIGEKVCYLQQLRSYVFFVSVICSKQANVVVHSQIHHRFEGHLTIYGKIKYFGLMDVYIATYMSTTILT